MIEADCVLDGGGRRSPVPRWLAEVGVDVPYDEQDCDGTYIGRYYRRNPESPLSPLTLIGNANGTPRLQFNSFPGDHDTFGLFLVIKPDDHELHALRNDAVFDAVLEKIPSLAAWGEPEHGTPLQSVEMMAGNRNRRFHYVVDDEPLVLGLIPIGDALCATNPFYGWGASMALTYAFEAADAIAGHDDLRDAALAYEAAIEAEADGVYRESAAADRRRYYESRNIEIPEWDRARWNAKRSSDASRPARLVTRYSGARSSGAPACSSLRTSCSTTPRSSSTRATRNASSRPRRRARSVPTTTSSRPSSPEHALRSGCSSWQARPNELACIATIISTAFAGTVWSRATTTSSSPPPTRQGPPGPSGSSPPCSSVPVRSTSWTCPRGSTPAFTGPAEPMLAALEAQKHRRFVKCHLAADGVPFFPQAKYIVVGRDTRDVFMSLWNHYSSYTDLIYQLLNDAERPGPEFPRRSGHAPRAVAALDQRGLVRLGTRRVAVLVAPSSSGHVVGGA